MTHSVKAASRTGFAAKVVANFELFFTRPILTSFALGSMAGFPLTIVFSLVSVWLTRYEVSLSAIGWFTGAGIFYSWKFLWSPAIDQISLGPLSRVLGQRRGWLFFLAGLIAVVLYCLGQQNPADNLPAVGALVMALAFLSASLDIVIDAYRIELVDESAQAHSGTFYTYGYRIANLVTGVGALYIAEDYGWGWAMALPALLLLPGLAASLWAGERGRSQEQLHALESLSFSERLNEAVVQPFKQFMERDHWLLILLFIVLLKAGDAVTAAMTNPLLVSMGYTNKEIADVSKVLGVVGVLVGAGVGALLYKGMGTYKALFLTAVLMMVTNLGFAWLAAGSADNWRLGIVVFCENFASGAGGVIIIAYFASLCDVRYTATQYALLSSLASQARSILAIPSGYMAEAFGWVGFFIMATLIALPGIFVLWLLWRRVPIEPLVTPQEPGVQEAGAQEPGAQETATRRPGQ